MKKYIAILFALMLAAPATAWAKVDDPSNKVVYSEKQWDKSKLFIVISKKDCALRVYGVENADTMIVAEYPVCLSRVKGNKQRVGDMKTPESSMAKPFTISKVQDASTWRHDFKDGRGNQLAYGHWFLRLVTPGHSGIGIHGSTGNEWSIPGSKQAVPAGRTQGRDSEGCIRLNDKDIIHLKENYVSVGMKVVVRPEGEGLLPFEKKALTMAEGVQAVDAISGHPCCGHCLDRCPKETLPIKPKTK